MPLQILYQDSDLLAVEKPSGQLVIPGRGEGLGEPMLQELERTLGRKIWVVHRLDRGASGLVLFAKSAAAHQRLCGLFQRREMKKSYQVVVQGIVEKGGTINAPIKIFGSGRLGVHPSGKPSLTDYEVLKPLAGSTLLQVMPHTGRRHQIRVHLYSIGHPVMGDPLYGKDRPVGGAPRLMLHAWKLEIPREGQEPLRLESPPPADLVLNDKPRNL